MDTLALAPGQFNNMAMTPLGPNRVASTNPVKNVTPGVLTQGQSFMGGIVNYDTATGKKLAPGATTLATPIANQSTTTLSSDKGTDILGAKNTLGSLSQKGVTTDPQTGTPTLANGQVYNPPDPNKPSGTSTSVVSFKDNPDGTTTNTLSDGTKSTVQYKQNPDGSLTPIEVDSIYDTSKQDAEINKNLDDMQAITDSQTATTIQNIKDKYARLKSEQEKANASTLAGTKTALLTSGAAQHDVFSDDAIAYRINLNTKQILDLEHEENDLIAAANAAALSGKYKILEQKNAEITKKRDEKVKATDELNKTIIAANTELRKKNEVAQSENAISTLYNQGITDPNEIAQKMKKAGYTTTLKDISDNVALISGQGGTGIVGEYNYYKAESIKKGQIPVSFNEYQNLDANRKAKVASAGLVAGYSPTVVTKITVKANQFVNETAVKNYQAIAESVDAVRNAGTSPTDDIQRIYAVAKVLDPSSAVKEGEYKTVEAYAQSLFQRAGKKFQRVFDNAGFLTPEARKYISDTLDNRLKSSEKAYKNIYDQYAQNINKLSGGTDGADFLTDYSKPFTTTGNNIIQSEEDAKTKIGDYGKEHPENKEKITQMITDNVSYNDILAYFNQ